MCLMLVVVGEPVIRFLTPGEQNLANDAKEAVQATLP